MPNRSKRKRKKIFFCPYCNRRLWRLGGQKHQISILCKHANLLAAEDKKLDDNSWFEGLAWTEEFICEQHGKVRMLVTRKADGTLAAVPAKSYARHQPPRTAKIKAPKLKARKWVCVIISH